MVNEKGHRTLAVFWNPCCVVGAAGGNSSRGTRPIVHPTQQPFHRRIEDLWLQIPPLSKKSSEDPVGGGGLFFSLS